MAEFYPWFVFVHLIGLVVFVACHGVSMFGAFTLRQQRDPRAIAGMLATGLRATRLAYVGLLLLAIGGIAAATSTNLWGQLWVIASVVVLIAILVVMYAVASPYYMGLRKTVGDGLGTGAEGSPVVDAAALATMLDTRRPDILLTVGGVGLVVLVWLMVLKPA
jgi:hypothetical protein